MHTATVLRIEKSSIHDGEGLRTVVFFKGCNLRCAWCSTPESQAIAPELGFEAGRCRNCGLCLSDCPAGARNRREDGFIATDGGLCRHCLRCVKACPSGAIEAFGRRMSVEEVLAEMLKDHVFFFHSGGGLTVSGGEPLLQAAFVAELLAGCRSYGINTAMETSFCLPWTRIQPLLPHLDTLFVDIKHSESATHQKLTGAGNEPIWQNIRQADAAEEQFSITVRLPLIPGLNDGEKNLLATARFAASLKKLRGLELLPYHRLGSATYARLGKEYALRDIAAPDAAYLEEKRAIIRDMVPLL